MSGLEERKCGLNILDKELGSGGYGVVYSIKKKKNKSHSTVIKVLRHKVVNSKDEVEEEPVTSFESLIEIDVLFRLRTPSLVMGFNIYEPSDCTGIKSVAIEMESLKDFKDLIGSTNVDPISKILFIYRMAVGIKCLHKNKILHLDIKPANVLYSGNSKPPFLKISDYGLSYQVDDINLGFSTTKLFGTRKYRPPEILGAVRLSKNKYKKIYDDPAYSNEKESGNIKFSYTNKFDVWSLGISAIYMIQSTPTEDTILDEWDELSHNNFYDKIKKMFSVPRKYKFLKCVVKTLNLSSKIEESFIDLLEGILNLDPDRRLDIDQVLKHDLFRMVEIVKMPHPEESGESDKLSSLVPIYKYYPKEKTSVSEDELVCDINPLTSEMINGVKYIIAAFKGPLKYLYVRDLFFSLDIYMRIIVACYTNKWSICRKLAILAMKMCFQYYNRSSNFDLEKYNEDVFSPYEVSILKLFKGIIRVPNLYDYTESASELKVYFEKLSKKDYDAFNYYFAIDYNMLRKIIRNKYDLEDKPHKTINCETFFSLKISKIAEIDRNISKRKIKRSFTNDNSL